MKMKKIGALVLALVMVLAMTTTAFATTTELTGGEVGGFYPGHVDDPQVQDKTVNIQKQITAYNPDETLIYGPAITYTYSIAAASGSELVSSTDDTADHASGVATVTAVLAGVMTPTLTGTSANTIAWTNSDILQADTVANGGAANIKNLTVDFSSIIFTQPGVYRYKITESATYDNTGVTDGTIGTVRYLDVYVMRSSTFNSTHDGSAGHEYVAADWSIYGYVCISAESVTTNAGGTTAVTTATVKTNGFVPGTGDDGSGGTTTYTADQYYTYNFTVTKDLVGDNTMINHQFPLTVAFSGGPTGTFQLIAETDGSKSSLTTTGNTATKDVNGNDVAADTLKKVGSAAALSSFANAGSPKVADGNTTTGTTTGYIKYIGIPYGAVASVTEENDVVGTTYQATVKEDVTTVAGTILVDATLTSTTGTMATSDTSASIDNTETATKTSSYTNAATTAADKNAAIQFTNTLAIVSPTGVAFRVAPYVLMLGAGIFLLVLTKRRNKDEEEAEA